MLDKYIDIVNKKIEDELKEIDKIVYSNSKKVLDAFHKEKVLTTDFNSSTGYGYNDIGRDKVEKVFADYFGCESALVRCQFVSGTHALSTAFFGILRPGDTLLSISGLPYDTLHEVIGIKDNPSSLKAFGINFKYIDLINNDFDYDKIRDSLNVKMVHIQRSIGYSLRDTLSIDKIEKVIKFIRSINKDVIIMIDNCYCEMCSYKEPTEIGADLVVGSLIKNLGGGIANNGGYICGKSELVNLCSERLTSPGLGAEVGPSLNQTRNFMLGFYEAPMVVGNALKTKVFARELLKLLGCDMINNELNDIVLGIVFNDREKLIKFVKGIQMGSAIDSCYLPVPTDMPGYDNQIIMASGSFTEGSSIELSCDAPIREPFVAYLQGALTFEYGKLGIIKAVENIFSEDDISGR
ncbi:MAG: methionine gamma-lyase family protein [Tenericutes bacterium]|nr:methionine gamma-lyase family protein [Mycoplasmatota bacterium]